MSPIVTLLGLININIPEPPSPDVSLTPAEDSSNIVHHS
jgi:hypothetical protein